MRIVVLDDEADARALTGELLVRLGHSVMTCGTNAEALAIIAAGGVDLLLADLALEGETGVQLMEEVLRQGLLEKRQIIAVTGMPFESEEARRCRAEKIMMVFKPFTFSQLRWAIEHATSPKYLENSN